MASSTVPSDVSASTDSISLRAHLGDPHSLVAYLERPGVLQTGHFRLLSGLHSDRFLAFSRIATDLDAVQALVALLYPTIAPWQASAVLAPSTAGVILASAIADRLGVGLHLATLDEQSRPTGIVGEPEVSGKRFLLVNDVVTTGQGIVALASTVHKRGAEVAGAAWFASRAEAPVEQMIGAPIARLLSLELPAVSAEGCELCSRGVELQDGLDLN